MINPDLDMLLARRRHEELLQWNCRPRARPALASVVMCVVELLVIVAVLAVVVAGVGGRVDQR